MGFFKITDLQRRRLDVSGALQFSGAAGQYGRVLNMAGLAMPADWSWVCVSRPMRMPPAGGGDFLFSNSSANNNAVSLRYLNDGGSLPSPHFYTNTSAGAVVKMAGGVVPIGSMVLMVVTRQTSGSQSVLRFYVNGLLTASQTITPCTSLATWSPTTTGTAHGILAASAIGTPSQALLGHLDVLPFALTPQDVTRLWNGGRLSHWRDVAYGHIQSVLRFEFNETSGATAFDSSGQTPATPRNMSLFASPAFVTF
jgi:hypothetical protein